LTNKTQKDLSLRDQLYLELQREKLMVSQDQHIPSQVLSSEERSNGSKMETILMTGEMLR